jgi:hypothetical protein
MTWAAVDRAALCHRMAHARVLAGEPMQPLYPVTPAAALSA